MRPSTAFLRAREVFPRRALRAVVAITLLIGSAGTVVVRPARGGPSPVAANAGGAPDDVVTLGEVMHAVPWPNADSAAAEPVPFVPGELIVRLRPRAASRVRGDRAGGFASAMSEDPAAVELDGILRRHDVEEIQRIFGIYEDAEGRRIDTADARLRRTRRAREQDGQRRLPPLPARTPDLENFFLVRMHGIETPGEVEAAMAELRGNDLVASVQPNFVYRALAQPLPAVPTLPDDPYVSADGASWSEGSFGNSFPDLYGVRNLHVLETWSLLDANGNGAFDGAETAPGEGVVVAVIDTGVDAAHPEVAGRLFVNPGEIPGDGVDNDANGRVDDVSGWDFVGNDSVPEDRNGHGTHVAGTIAAGANNAEGITGIAPFARILPIKALNDAGFGSTVGLAAAVHYAAMVGAHITSNSWGGSFVDEFLEAAFENAEASGVLSVAAAGNSGRPQLAAPALFESVVAVAAVDDVDALAPFSSWGVGLDLCAPGAGVLSLSANDHDNALAASTGRTVGDRYLWLNGTSMAAPHASGVAALMMSLHPAESAAEIRGRLMQAAIPIEAQNPGHEDGLGTGRVDALASALAAPVPLLRPVDIRIGAIVEGEAASIDVTLKNFWSPATGVHVSLGSDDPDVIIVEGERDFGGLAIGERDSRTFEIEMAQTVEIGKEIELLLTITADGAPRKEHGFSIRRSFFANQGHLAGLGPFPVFVLRATFGDFDNDGLPDMGIGSYVEGIHLYPQQPDGTFDDRTPAGSGQGRFPVFADMNNDGLLDLLAVGALDSGVILAVNVGGGQFAVLPDSSGFHFPQGRRVTSLTPIDLDADGDLDVIAGLFGVFQDDQGVFRDLVVLRNEGDLTFSDAWAETGIHRTAGSGQYLTLDWDGDGFQDLLSIQGTAERVSLHRGRGNGRFEDVTGVAFPGDVLSCADFAMGGCELFRSAASGDYDNDGDTDLVFSIANNVSAEEQSALILLANDGTGVFSDVTDQAGDLATVRLLSGLWGTSFFDLENDGDLDLFVPIDIILQGSPARSPEDKIVILRNDGGGHFTHVSDVALPPDTPVASLVAAVGDYDGDGAQDILAPVSAIPGLVGGLMQNLAGGEHAWLEVELDSVDSAPNGYGARVTLVADGRVQTREVLLSPVEPWRVHFGLGDAAIVDVLEVRWPSGVVAVQRNVAVDQLFRVDEGSPCPEFEDAQCPTVAIDVDPKSDENPVNPQSKKLLTVAILGSASFDAAQVDATRTFFGPGRSTAVHRAGGHLVDVNEDGWVDWISHHRVGETGIEAGDVEACLRGQMQDRTPFSGCVHISTPTSAKPR